MPGIVCVGTQWGDEGKGKITDVLASEMDMVVRYQGGNNAGHTIVVDGQELKLHLIPSGVLFPRATPVIANGVVLDLEVLTTEMEELRGKGVSTDKLLISNNAHLIMPYHQELDRVRELRMGRSKIGTTRKGIGPAYADKASRTGVRVQDLLDPKIFREKVKQALDAKNKVLTKLYGVDPLSFSEITERFEECARKIRDHIADTTLIINRALMDGKKVYFEGAQGTLLDLDHGTYPYVTSSSPTAGGACIGTGVPPARIDRVVGIAKAYTTRVGSGPFPTEDGGAAGEAMRAVGREFGTTTGRARRCGWFDGVLLNYAVMVNGISSVVVTKLDVLSQFETVKICTEYRNGTSVYTSFPAHQSDFHHCEPVYEEMDGWSADISGVSRFEALPRQAQDFIKRIEGVGGAPVDLVSVGPDRRQTIVRRKVS